MLLSHCGVLGLSNPPPAHKPRHLFTDSDAEISFRHHVEEVLYLPRELAASVDRTRAVCYVHFHFCIIL